MVATTIAFLAGQQSLRADGPNFQIIAHWDLDNGCVTNQAWADDTEDIVKQTLAVEMGGDDLYEMEALKANATIIRQDSLFYRSHPEYPGFLPPELFCQGVTPYAFDWRDSRMAFVSGAYGEDQYAAVDATWGIGWFKSGVPQTDFNFQPWGSEMQNCTQTQALAGWGYQAIVGSGNWPPGVFSPSTP